MYNLLETSHFPKDLKSLCRQDIERLILEVREKLMEIKDRCGGHLASNLGVVELTIALHTVFDSPRDKFVWDVSHQCYVHKLLTGRLDNIFTLKQYGGLSGFAKIDESEHDAFGAGHASTALSAGLGMAHARDIQKKDYSVISIIGDASLSGGMSYEALNNMDTMKGNFICILNDNDMSISRPVGGMAKYMTSIRSKPIYDRAKRKFERVFNKIPKIGDPLKRRIEKTVERIRNTIIDSKVGVLFEEFGVKYLGPLDGHNVALVMAALKYAKTYPGPIMIHLITKKGKGYTPAEENPVKYHGVSAKKNLTHSSVAGRPSYTSIFGKKIIDLAKKDSKLVVITPAMCEGSGLVEYAKLFPKRYFDVGIAEEHAVTFAAGMARVGLKPVVAIYSTFLQRGYDQIIHDICLQKLPVIFAIDRAGLVGADGPTHHGVFDYNYLLPIPNIHILAPKDGSELEAMLAFSLKQDIAVSIRYPRGSIPVEDNGFSKPILLGKAEIISVTPKKEKLDICFIAAGSMVWPAQSISKALDSQGYNSIVINLRFIKPLDIDTLVEYIPQAKQVIVLEEGQKIGGVHSHVLQRLNEYGIDTKHVSGMGIPDQFIEHGSVDELKESISLSIEKIKAILLNQS